MTYSNSYVKAIIVSTFWSATTKYLPQTNSVVRQEFSCLRISALTICQFYFIVAYNFLHTKHYSISDLFRIFLYSTKSNLVTFRWLQLQLKFAGIPSFNGVIYSNSYVKANQRFFSSVYITAATVCINNWCCWHVLTGIGCDNA